MVIIQGITINNETIIHSDVFGPDLSIYSNSNYGFRRFRKFVTH